jgi:hypothetical protein
MPKLSVEIQLDGAKEIEQQLAGISKAGQQCFADISKAAEQAGGFAKLDPAVIEQKFKQLGVVVPAEMSKIRAALQSSATLEATVLGVANLERGFKNTAIAARSATGALGLTRGEIGALGKALRSVDLGVFGRELALASRVGGAFGPLALGITLFAGAIVGAAAALIKFSTEASATEKSLTQLQKVSGVSFKNLSSLQQVFEGGGTSVAKFAEEFGNLSEKIAASGQQKAMRDAGKATVDWANDIDQVTYKFRLLADGATEPFSPLTTLDTKVKALLETLSKVDAADQWSRLADIFKNLDSELERVQLGKALGLSPETIATLSQGSRVLSQLQTQAGQLGLTLTSSNQAALQQMSQQWNQFSGLLSAFFQKIGALAAPAFGQMLGIFTQVMQQIVSDFQNLPLDQAIGNLGQRLGPAFDAIGNILGPIIISIGTSLGEALGRAFVRSVQASISEGLANMANKWGFGGGSSPSSGSGGGGGGGFAGGGLLGGRGSGTSDSNLAWVSRGEYIVPARAVAQPGVLAFLEALRLGMGHFALGGMVRGPLGLPSFAGGGMNNVTIAFPGLPEIAGLRASSGVVDELHRAAAMAQVRSGGRKPSRFS